jgi:hypothetical protein
MTFSEFYVLWYDYLVWILLGIASVGVLWMIFCYKGPKRVHPKDLEDFKSYLDERSEVRAYREANKDTVNCRCGTKFEDIVGEFEDVEFYGIRCPNGCDLSRDAN